MYKLRFTIILTILIMISGCSVSHEYDKKFPVSPVSVGFMAEKTEERLEELETQNRVKIVNRRGSIILKPWEGSGIKLNAIEMVKGLRSRSALNKSIEEINIEVEKKPYTVIITVKYPENLPLLTGQGTRLEVMVPEEIIFIDAEATEGNIYASGFEKIDDINLKTESGNISISDVITREYEVNINTGKLTVEQIGGKGKINASRAETILKGITGDLDYRGTSGKALISKYTGKLSCNISAGTVEVNTAEIATGSEFYATSGNLKAKGLSFDNGGSYSLITANGEIALLLPEDAGFEMDARTYNGRIESEFLPEDFAKDGKKLPKALKGTVGSGGPEIILYSMSGKIKMSKIK